MPTVNQTHDLVVEKNGTRTGFFTVPNSWRVGRANDFNPRIATGKPTHSDQDMWSTISIEDVAHGLGAEYVRSDPQRYLEADGEIDTSIAGHITLAAQWVASDASFVAYCFWDYGNYMMAGGATSIRKCNSSDTTWSNTKTSLGAAVVDLAEYGGNLYAALGTANDIVYCTSKTDPDNNWSTWTGKKAQCFTVWKTNLVRGHGQNIWIWNGSTDSSVTVTDSGANVIGLSAVDTLLVIFCDNGKYYSYDGTTVSDLDTYAAYSGNFKYPARRSGWLYFNVLGDVMRIAGLASTPTVQAITPTRVGSEKTGWGLPVAFTSSPKYTYCLFHDSTLGPTLLKFNDQGWHTVYRGAAGATANSCYYSRVCAKLWVNDGTSRYQKMNTLNDTPAADYATSTTRRLYLPHITADFDDLDKIFREIKVVSSNLSANVKAVFYRQLDRSGTWTLVGSATASPETEIAFAEDSAVKAKDLWLAVDLVTDSATVTPDIKGIYVTYMLRPKTVLALTTQIIAEEGQVLKDGSGEDTLTADQIITLLMDYSDTAEPITVEAPDGLSYQVVQTQIGWQEVGTKEA